MKTLLSYIDLSVVKIFHSSFLREHGIAIIHFDTLDDDRSLFGIYIMRGQIFVDLFFIHILK